MPRSPTNTTAQDPMLHLAEAMVHGPRGGSIEAQEARGQRELVASDVLPADGSDNPAWAKMGVIFGAPVQGDPIFRAVTLPAGWKKEGTDHAMCSKLLDDNGRKRADIFYKAAFYDRSAHISPSRRFSVRQVYGKTYDANAPLQFEVTDRDRRVFATEEVVSPGGRYGSPEDVKRQDDEKRLSAECAAWLVSNGFPSWEDASAHWDD